MVYQKGKKKINSTCFCQGVSFTHDPNMKHVRFISTTTIQPTRSNAHDHHPDDHNQFTPRIELTPWDIRYLKIDYIRKGLLFPKPKQTSGTTLALMEHLKATLTRTLDIFYPTFAATVWEPSLSMQLLKASHWLMLSSPLSFLMN